MRQKAPRLAARESQGLSSIAGEVGRQQWAADTQLEPSSSEQETVPYRCLEHTKPSTEEEGTLDTIDIQNGPDPGGQTAEPSELGSTIR